MKYQLLIILILLTANVYAYVPLEEYKGIKMKYYYVLQPGERETCKNMIDSIPDKYLEGLRIIKVFDGWIFFRLNRLHSWGTYSFLERQINVYIGCDEETFIHELAHHRQNMMNESIQEAYNHTGNFLNYYREIINSTQEINETFI